MAVLKFDLARLELDEPNKDHSLRDESQWAYCILSDYVQPESSMSLDEAIDHAAQHCECQFGRPSILLGIVVALAEQIPFDNPAHSKLAHFFMAFWQSDKWLPSDGSNTAPETTDLKLSFLGQANIELYDRYIDPEQLFEEGDDPMDYVNVSALYANLFLWNSPGMSNIYYIASFQRTAMESAFESDHSKEQPSVRDAYIMGAAQHITWSAAKLYSLMLHPDDPAVKRHNSQFQLEEKAREEREQRERETKSSGCWPFSGGPERRRRREVEKIATKAKIDFQESIEGKWPHSMDQWRAWRRGFRAAAKNEMYSVTCRRIAEEAADLMRAHEKVRLNA